MTKNAGEHTITWKISDNLNKKNQTDVYIYRIKSNGTVVTGKIHYIN